MPVNLFIPGSHTRGRRIWKGRYEGGEQWTCEKFLIGLSCVTVFKKDLGFQALQALSKVRPGVFD